MLVVRIIHCSEAVTIAYSMATSGLRRTFLRLLCSPGNFVVSSDVIILDVVVVANLPFTLVANPRSPS